MAVAYDAVSEGTLTNSSSKTLSHTCTGSNLLLVAFVHNCLGTAVPTGVTYNGVSMTLITSLNGSTSEESLHAYRLSAPSTGANNISVTFAAATDFKIGGISFTGTNGTTNGTQISTDPSNTPNSVTVTSATNAMICSGMVIAGIRPTFTYGGSQTARYNTNAGGDCTTAAGASSVDMSYSNGSGFRVAQIAFNIPELSAGSAGNLLLLGVGT